ncbi:hypothetical protein FB567DRAFT_521075 [Paraphoma chrysanthemicola]|uniref:Uncharacterized protein n=1 Tax=Paraphoma chrysanthemicola TaxID=798071 RepID=A0A8K0RBS9_9PLEO|nr:hypothetical protein FB567DRAFT_521075 [Paraphoma chrysanthemicola]
MNDEETSAPPDKQSNDDAKFTGDFEGTKTPPEPPIIPESAEVAVNPKATIFASTSWQPAATNSITKMFALKFGFRTSEENQARWENAMLGFITPRVGVDGASAPMDEASVKASLIAARVEEVRDKPGATKFDSDEQFPEQDPPPQLEQESEQGVLTDEQAAEEVPLPDKGNFRSFSALIAAARAEREEVGLAPNDDNKDEDEFRDIPTDGQCLSVDILEDESSFEEITHDKVSKDHGVSDLRKRPPREMSRKIT